MDGRTGDGHWARFRVSVRAGSGVGEPAAWDGIHASEVGCTSGNRIVSYYFWRRGHIDVQAKAGGTAWCGCNTRGPEAKVSS
jgi:hypothetical protein